MQYDIRWYITTQYIFLGGRDMKRRIVLIVILFSIIFTANVIAEPISPLMQVITDGIASIKAFYLNITNTKMDELDVKYEGIIDIYADKKATEVKTDLTNYVNQQVAGVDTEMNNYVKAKETEVDVEVASQLAIAKEEIAQDIEESKQDKKAKIDKMFDEKLKVKFQMN